MKGIVTYHQARRGRLRMGSGHVPDDEFRKLVERRAQKLLSLLDYLSRCGAPREALTRPFLGDLLSQAIQVDHIGAGGTMRQKRSRYVVDRAFQYGLVGTFLLLIVIALVVFSALVAGYYWMRYRAGENVVK